MNAEMNATIKNGVSRMTTASSAGMASAKFGIRDDLAICCYLIVMLDAFKDIFNVWSGTRILCPASGYQFPMSVSQFLRARGMGAVVECNQNLAVPHYMMIR
jgi:hypothetical protein